MEEIVLLHFCVHFPKAVWLAHAVPRVDLIYAVKTQNVETHEKWGYYNTLVSREHWLATCVHDHAGKHGEILCTVYECLQALIVYYRFSIFINPTGDVTCKVK